MKVRLLGLRISGITLAIVFGSIACGWAQEGTKDPASKAASNGVPAESAVLAPISLPKLAVGLPETPAPQVQPVPAPPASVSAWTKAITKMAQAGVGEDVMLTYIDGAGTFNLSADDIVYLRDLGIASQVIVAMIEHDSDIVSGVQPLTMAAPPATDLPMPFTIMANSDLQGAVTQPSVTLPVPVASTQDSTGVPLARPLSAPEVNTASGLLADPILAVAASPASSVKPPPVPRVQKVVYPVREPNPVELVPPITVVEMPPPERPLTTVVIHFVP